MFRFVAKPLKIVPMLLKAALFSAALAAPVLAVPLSGGNGLTIEAPTMKKSGAGFVLMVSLQRG